MLILTSPILLIAVILLIEKLVNKNTDSNSDFSIEDDGWDYIR